MDRVLKKANSKDGIVKIKNVDTIKSDPSCIAVNENYIAVGTDDGDLYVFEQTNLNLVKHIKDVHYDNMASIIPLIYKNKHHFVSCGSSTVVHWDIRKEEPISESEDQEDEILCGCLASEKYMAFGMGTGVLTIWNEFLEDQQQRIRLSKESIDTVIPGELDNIVIAGSSDGYAYKVDVKSSKILSKWKHGSDGVSFLEMDYDYHLVTADMENIKIWMTEEEEKKAIKEEKKKQKSEGDDSKDKKDDSSDSDDWETEDEESKKKEDKKRKRKRGKASTKSKIHKTAPAIASFSDL